MKRLWQPTFGGGTVIARSHRESERQLARAATRAKKRAALEQQRFDSEHQAERERVTARLATADQERVARNHRKHQQWLERKQRVSE